MNIDNTQTDSKNRLLQNVLILFVLIFIVSQLTTQFMAHQFQGSFQLHQPWKWVSWSNFYWNSHPALVKQGVAVFGFGLALCFLMYAYLMVLRGRKVSAIKGLHGTAHWATRKEVVKSGLIPQGKEKGQGVYIGGWFDEKANTVRYLRHNGPEHILAFAPTRSGKGVGLVLPTLLSWEESVICYDIKGENWALTSGWRQKYANNKVMKFDPASNDGSGVAFNPLEEVRIGTDKEVGDAQNIATMLVDPDGKGLNDHWSKSSHALLTACIIHVGYAIPKEEQRQACLADIGDLLANPDYSVEEVLDMLLEYQHTDNGVHPLVAQEARAMLNKDERELGGVLSSAISYLTLYRDPVICQNTAHSDFTIHDLMNDEQPVSLYLVVRPSDADRVRPLIRLLLTQVVRKLTERMEFKEGQSVKHYKHRLLLLIDEFASLKTLNVIEEALAFMAGYGLKAYLIVQDLQQITKSYTKDEGLMGNCHVRIAYAPNKIDTAEALSKMSGQTTIIKKQTTVSGKRYGQSLGQVSESMQEVQRNLITADEVMRLPGMEKDAHNKISKAGDMLIFIAGQSPIYGRQILYFMDEKFKARANLPAPKTSDTLKNMTKKVKEDALLKFS